MGLANDIEPCHRRVPGIRLQQGGEDPDRGGLAGAVRPQEAKNAAFGNGEIQPIEGPNFRLASLVDLDEPFGRDRPRGAGLNHRRWPELGLCRSVLALRFQRQCRTIHEQWCPLSAFVGTPVRQTVPGYNAKSGTSSDPSHQVVERPVPRSTTHSPYTRKGNKASDYCLYVLGFNLWPRRSSARAGTPLGSRSKNARRRSRVRNPNARLGRGIGRRRLLVS